MNSPEDQPTLPTAPPAGTRSGASSLGWQAPSVEELQEKLPQYEVIEILGRGGMGAVYKARQKSLKRLVAIKILPLGMADDEFKFVERFENEAQTMAQMNHPAIVSVYDFGETSDGLLYFVMEFVDGTDVHRMIQSSGRLSGEYALAITAHVCDALAYAHKRGVIHRDIKPANILIDQEGHIKVADFGLAKMHDPSQTSGLTKTNMAMGTPDYVAPEVLSPGMVADHRADLYAVGVMLYQMLTGEVPRGMFKLPSQKGIGTDPRIDEIICKAMEQDREERYQSATEVRHALDAILTTPMPTNEGTGTVSANELPRSSVATSSLPSVQQDDGAQKSVVTAKVEQPPKKKSPAAMWMSVGGIVAVLGVAGFAMLGDKSKPQVDADPSASNAAPSTSGVGKVDAVATSADAPPSLNNWQDMTDTLREKARGVPELQVEGGVVRHVGKGNTVPLRLTDRTSGDCAVRLRFVGDGQVDIHATHDGMAYVLCQRTQTIIQRQMRTASAPVRLIPAVVHPVGYDPALPHELIVTAQGPTIRAWVDGRFVGEAQDQSFTTGGAEIAFTKFTTVLKVEIADLPQNASPPVPNAKWQDVTATLRDSAKAKPGVVMEGELITWNGDKQNPPHFTVTPEGQSDYAVRLKHVGAGQINVRFNEKGFIYVQAAPSGVRINRWMKGVTAPVSLLVAKDIPFSYSKGDPHDLTVTVQGSTISAWLDGQLMGTVDDTMFAKGTGAVSLVSYGKVQKVEIAELNGSAAKGDWQPIFMKPEDFGGDLRDVEFRDGAVFLMKRSHLAPASATAIRSTLRFCASERTGSLSLRSAEGAAYGEEDFACMAFVSPSGGMVIKVRDRTTGSPELKRHDFPLSPALKLEEFFTFELRAADGKITASINGHEVGSVPDTWKGGARRFSITPSVTEMTEFRDVAVMKNGG